MLLPRKIAQRKFRQSSGTTFRALSMTHDGRTAKGPKFRAQSLVVTER